MSHSEGQRAGGAADNYRGTPLVTAIVVARNDESHIRECVLGLAEQTVADRMEVIVVDQASEQSEAAIIADLQRRHKNLILLRIPAGDGRYAGVGLAVRIASGRYLSILDAADRLNNDAYQLMSAALDQHPEAVLAYGNTCFTAIPHETFAKHTSYGSMVWPDYSGQQLGRLSEVAPHPMWRKELSENAGSFGTGDNALRDLMLRAADASGILHLPEFTGLKLFSPQATPKADDAEREAAPKERSYRDALQALLDEPAPWMASSFSEPAQEAAPEMGADEAFARLTGVVNGEEPWQAAQAIEKHLEKHPQHAVAHNDLGALYYRLGEKEKSLRHYRQAVELSPRETTYRKNLADMLYVEAGEVDEAIAIYLELHKEAPRDVETLLNLGIICEGVGQPAEAESFYQRALEIEPWNQVVRERLSELRVKEAEAGADDDDEAAEDRYQRAQELVAKGELEAALTELERTISVYPEFSPAHNDLAVLYYQKGEKEEALAHYEKAAALAPGNSTFQKNLADFYFVEGRNVDGAIAIYLDQLRKEPRNVETLMNLGKICAILDRPAEAESFYAKVAELEPWNRDARECLSSVRQCVNG